MPRQALHACAPTHRAHGGGAQIGRLWLLFSWLVLPSACEAQHAEPSSTTTTTASSGAASSSSTGGSTIVADCRDGWCRIPPGTFVMGSPPTEWGHPARDEDQVEVTLTRGFLIQQHELTQAEWTSLGFHNASGLINGKGDCLEPSCPVGNVTWFAALAAANRFSARHGLPVCYELGSCDGHERDGSWHPALVCDYETVKITAPTVYDCPGYRLPTEAEWEYAARAGTTTTFYSGDITQQENLGTCAPDANLEPIAWFCHYGGSTTHPVGEKEPNGWGLYDMLGNSHEWVFDHYTPSGYGQGPLTDPDGTFELNDARVFRGGAFNLWSSACRVARRSYAPFSAPSPAVSFRLVRTLQGG